MFQEVIFECQAFAWAGKFLFLIPQGSWGHPVFLVSALPILMQCGDREKSDRESGATLKSFFFIVVFLDILLWLFLFRLVIDLLI